MSQSIMPHLPRHQHYRSREPLNAKLMPDFEEISHQSAKSIRAEAASGNKAVNKDLVQPQPTPKPPQELRV